MPISYSTIFLHDASLIYINNDAARLAALKLNILIIHSKNVRWNLLNQSDFCDLLSVESIILIFLSKVVVYSLLKIE